MQLGTLALLIQLGAHYMVATALGVEAAVLQNYYWHTRWTWKGREGSLWRFHLANGLLSLLSNLVWMRLFTGWLGIPPLPANLMAIALTSTAKPSGLFRRDGDRWVFARAAKRSDWF